MRKSAWISYVRKSWLKGVRLLDLHRFYKWKLTWKINERKILCHCGRLWEKRVFSLYLKLIDVELEEFMQNKRWDFMLLLCQNHERNVMGCFGCFCSAWFDVGYIVVWETTPPQKKNKKKTCNHNIGNFRSNILHDWCCDAYCESGDMWLKK